MDNETKGKGLDQTGNGKTPTSTPKQKKSSKIAAYFKGVVGEVRKLAWPTRKDLISYTLTVLAFVAIFALIIGLLDMVFEYGIIGVKSLTPIVTATPTPTIAPTPTPTATVDPDATDDPDATADPSATVDPDATDDPDATEAPTTEPTIEPSATVAPDETPVAATTQP